MKFHSIRFKLIISLIAISLFIGLVSLLVGGNLLYSSVISEASNRIGQDLNVARVIYDNRINSVHLAIQTIATDVAHRRDPSNRSMTGIAEALKKLADQLQLDIWGINDAQGNGIPLSATKNSGKSSAPPLNPMVQQVLENQKNVAGTVILDHDQLLAENSEMADRAVITVREQTEVDDSEALEDTKGMVGGAAVPLFLDGRFAGVIYGGYLMNQDTVIVDKIGATVFQNEIYKNRNVGTATIFHNDLRIATSVKDRMEKRAIGTLASPEVARHVLDEGGKWTDRAKVLDEWYITAYEPIVDIFGNRVGMLYVGVLEAKYSDVRTKAIAVFTAITLTGVAIAIILGWLFTGRIMRPVSNLIKASAEISNGNFSPDIGAISKDDIGMLQQKFLVMANALEEREERQKIESETRLMQSEKQSSVGKLAAGVAHEINNPLTAVLTFTHLILRRDDLPDEVRSDLETVVSQTERVRQIVKGLLDFSRQTEIDPQALNINTLIADCVKLMENQTLIKGVDLSFEQDEDISILTLDRNQSQSVMINMIINALDATPNGGKIEIQTRKAETDDGPGVEIQIADTGSGIAPEHMDHLFDPFFTTKKVGKGTGLGLAVSAGIIERHGGTISVKSKLQHGTTFSIWLPNESPDSETRVEASGDEETA